MQPDIIHGHGAKGGAVARLIGSRLRVSGSCVARLYSPHGGSLHYRRSSPTGRFYFLLERLFERQTDGLVFVSDYERRVYSDRIGVPRVPTFLIRNGLSEREFDPVSPLPDAADFLFVGMMRHLKGPDIFIEAFRQTERIVGRPLRAAMIGDGEDKAGLEHQVLVSGLKNRILFYPAMQVRQAFRHGHIMVVPSRAESMPYIVLEALAARLPLIASNVGGIPEILGDDSPTLVPADDPTALAGAMARAVAMPEDIRLQMPDPGTLKATFSARTMADRMIETYRQCDPGE